MIDSVKLHAKASKDRKVYGSKTYFYSEHALSKKIERITAYKNPVVRYDKEILAEYPIILKSRNNNMCYKNHTYTQDIQHNYI